MVRRSKKFSDAFLLEISRRIRSLVVDGESDRAFSRRIGVSCGAMSEYLSGSRMPSLESLILISRATQVSLDWLAFGNDSPAKRGIHIAAHGKHSIAAGGDVVVHQAKK